MRHTAHAGWSGARAARIAAAVVAGILLFPFATAAQSGISLTGIPRYQPQAHVSGVIRVWGHGAWGRDFMADLVNRWESDFSKYQPGIRFENHLLGTATAMGALYTGTGDIAILGREVRPSELDAFERVMGHRPVGVDVVAGSFNVPNKDFALGIFVNRANPLRGLTMKQLAEVFGCAQAGQRPLRTWGDLGLTGGWAARPIHVYGYQIRRGFGVYFDQMVLGGSGRWNCHYKELMKTRDSSGAMRDDGQVIVDTVAADPDAIAFSGMAYTNPGARTVALARRDPGPFVPPTAETVFARSYPLFRVLTSFVDRRPNAPLDLKLREFLRFVLSREGQQDVLDTGGYLPLNPEVVRRERGKLQ